MYNKFLKQNSELKTEITDMTHLIYIKLRNIDIICNKKVQKVSNVFK